MSFSFSKTVEDSEKDFVKGVKNKAMAMRQIRVSPCPEDQNSDVVEEFKSFQDEISEEDGTALYSKREVLLLVASQFVSTIMPQAFMGSIRPFMLMWRLAYLAFITILLLQTYQTFADYFTHPVVVSMTLKKETGPVEFPAVTICNNNMVKKSMISRISYLRDLAALDDYVKQKLALENDEDLNSRECDEDNHKFRCDNGMCISDWWVCNERDECEDGSDESSCPDGFGNVNTNQTCSQGYFLCPSETTCVTACDGRQECVLFPGYDETLEAGCNDSCLMTLNATETAAELTSPGFPTGYNDYLDCEYKLVAPDGMTIKLEFKRFEVEFESSCMYDSMRIQDGESAFNSKWISIKGSRVICGIMNENSLPTVQSTRSVVIVYFKSDSSFSEAGWKLTYQAVASGGQTRLKRSLIDSGDGDGGGYESGYDSDYSYSSDYDYDYDNYDTTSAFTGLTKYDWVGALEKSEMPDYSDFKEFVKLEGHEIIGNGHQFNDFIIQCVFDGSVCSGSMFHTAQNRDFGNCYSFNSVVDPFLNMKSKPVKSGRTGFQSGLKLSLFLDKEEYIGVIGQNSGARLTFSNPEESPPVSSKAVYISAGSATIINLQYETIQKQSEPFSNCTETWPASLELSKGFKMYTYTQGFCEDMCLQIHLVQSCGCSLMPDYHFSANPAINSKSGKACDAWNSEEMTCVATVKNNIRTYKILCDCPPACFERIVNTKTSTAEWPTDSYTPYFARMLKRSTSKQVQDFISFAVQDSGGGEDLPKLSANLRKNFARVEIYFESLDYVEFEENPKYNIPVLCGTLGGNMGLWLGWSVLTAFEVLQWGVTTLFILVSRSPSKTL